MNPHNKTCIKYRKRQTGAVATEYLIGLIFVVIVLLVPIPTQDGKNALQLLTDAVKQEHSGYIKAVSLPPLPDTSELQGSESESN